MEQDGSSGFNPQTWDLDGNETDFFVRDVTHASSLPFGTMCADKRSYGCFGRGYRIPDLEERLAAIEELLAVH